VNLRNASKVGSSFSLLKSIKRGRLILYLPLYTFSSVGIAPPGQPAHNSRSQSRLRSQVPLLAVLPYPAGRRAGGVPLLLIRPRRDHILSVEPAGVFRRNPPLRKTPLVGSSEFQPSRASRIHNVGQANCSSYTIFQAWFSLPLKAEFWPGLSGEPEACINLISRCAAKSRPW
jgi:hypothetical protein